MKPVDLFDFVYKIACTLLAVAAILFILYIWQVGNQGSVW